MFLTDWGHLIVDDYGVFLRKKHGRIVVVSKGSGRVEFPVRRVKMVIVSGKAGISSDLLKYLASMGVDVLITSYTGRPVALFTYARSGGSVKNRIEQYMSLSDGRACRIASMIIAGKLGNQISNMKYYSKTRRGRREAEILYEKGEQIKMLRNRLKNIDDSDLESCRQEVMSIEAQAANIYWDGMKIVLGKYGFEERLQRRDRVREPDLANLCLNISYNNLSGTIWKYTLRFSLDPFQGFLHSRRPGKLSLVYDLMEPYRPIIDRFVTGFLYKTNIKELEEKSKAEIARILSRKYYEEFTRSKIEYRGRSMPVEATVFWFIQSIISYLNGKSTTIYPPYIPW